MPQIIPVDDARACSLPEAIEALAALDFDPDCEQRTAQAARWLRRLTNNRSFLGDLLVDLVTRRSGGGTAIDSGYGPQAIVLSPHRTGASGGMFLRANIWPAEQDLCFRNSGARSFVYGVPHDHDFSFLTSGYFGPGYRSDYFEYDYESVAGFAGEKVDLKFIERSALHPGKLMLYRRHLDIHSQLPPESLSVSLNVMHVDPVQCWFDQYGFDLEEQCVNAVLSPNSTETFLRVAVATGAGEALDLAEQIGKSHPSDRLRLASFEARAARCPDADGEDALWRTAEASGSRMVEAVARERRAALA
ncbi:transposase [Erythrobacter sp. JK5]|uniref:transposase n=1 Tax=Erythrobacter sp. JK5 TaxID=2829500 RepID=UPI001BA6AE6E|nr:transposase [Erythrobacter sp. JK5]QUL39229.1 transposase [Erythrobacter sp. JK5]